MQNSYKIVFILHTASSIHGSNKSFLNILDGLKHKAFSFYVILPNRGVICDELNKRNISFIILPYRLSVYPRTNSFKSKFLFIRQIIQIVSLNYLAVTKLTNQIRKINPHIIHTNIGPCYIGHKIAKKLCIPHVWHLREFQGSNFNFYPLFSMKGFLKKIHYKNNYPIAISQAIYNYYSLTRNAVIIYNGINKKLCTQFIRKKKKYFLFAGRLEEDKGIKELIIGYSIFVKKHPDYFLFIAGDTTNIKYKQSLLKLIDNFGINEKIIFMGLRNDIDNLMAFATAVVVPSKYEGFGRVTAESMFNGCLVIGYNADATKEILEANNVGILYSNTDELVNAMKMVVSNGIQSYYPMIKRAQKQASSLYSQEKNTSSILNLYHNILFKKE